MIPAEVLPQDACVPDATREEEGVASRVREATASDSGVARFSNEEGDGSVDGPVARAQIYQINDLV